MLSKQDKLKYGQELRRQMKQREEKKMIQQMEKRGIKRSPTDTRIPVQAEFYPDNKQALQNRFESQQADYYGRPGGGAPNKQNTQANYQAMLPQQPSYNPNMQNPMPRMKPSQQRIPYSNETNFNQNYNYSPPQIPQPSYENLQRGYKEQSQPYQKNNPSSYQSIQQMEQMQQSNNSPYAPPSYVPNPNIPNQGSSKRISVNYQINDQYQQFQMSKPQQQYGSYNNYQQDRNFGSQNYPNKPTEIYQNPIQQINQKHEAYRQKAQQNQQLMELHKKGGRNLLKLENMTIDQQQIKQKQKQEMRRQLELQMKEAQERKKQEAQRRKREELEQQRKNDQYIEMQKRRMQEEQQKKIDQKRQLQQQNARNLQQRRRLEEQAKQKLMREKMKNQQPQNYQAQTTIQNSPYANKKEAFSKQSQLQIPKEQTVSLNGSETELEKTFRTNISRKIFEDERRKDQQRYQYQQRQRYARQKNLQAVTDQIRRLKDQIDQQNHLFMKEIQKVKLQSEMAENQKRKAQAEIENLKMQLKKKMEDDNQRLFLALQRQDQLVKEQQDYYVPPKRANERRSLPPSQQSYPDTRSNYVESLRPVRDEKFVKKQYQVKRYEVPSQQMKRPPSNQYNQKYNQKYNKKLMESNVNEDDEMLSSLHGDSKKIPLNIPDQLSMSKLEDFARKTQFFKGDEKNTYLEKKKSYQYHDSIAEEDQERVQSKAAQRMPGKNFKNQKDQLDRLVESRNKQRESGWGELSSVNSDITKQIEELLKKKDYPMQPLRPPSGNKYEDNSYPSKTNERPTSRLSNAGKKSLSRGGIQYDGASIGTLNSNAGIGTLDIDKIQNRNDRRLNELRNLGVETINTNNDQQFSKLDMILNKYKQSRVL